MAQLMKNIFTDYKSIILQILQNRVALQPKWLHSSDPLALSHKMHMRGAITYTSAWHHTKIFHSLTTSGFQPGVWSFLELTGDLSKTENIYYCTIVPLSFSC